MKIELNVKRLLGYRTAGVNGGKIGVKSGPKAGIKD